jgi:hypothetical protein
MIYVIDASYVDGYRLRISFSDGREGIVDLRDTILEDNRPIFLELKELEKFKRFHVDLATVVWENGVDIAPEYLYEKLESVPG